MKLDDRDSKPHVSFDSSLLHDPPLISDSSDFSELFMSSSTLHLSPTSPRRRFYSSSRHTLPRPSKPLCYFPFLFLSIHGSGACELAIIIFTLALDVLVDGFFLSSSLSKIGWRLLHFCCSAPMLPSSVVFLLGVFRYADMQILFDMQMIIHTFEKFSLFAFFRCLGFPRDRGSFYASCEISRFLFFCVEKTWYIYLLVANSFTLSYPLLTSCSARFQPISTPWFVMWMLKD